MHLVASGCGGAGEHPGDCFGGQPLVGGDGKVKEGGIVGVDIPSISVRSADCGSHDNLGASSVAGWAGGRGLTDFIMMWPLSLWS